MNEKQVREEFKTVTEGYESLITPEMLQKAINVHNATLELLKDTTTLLEKLSVGQMKHNPYQEMQLVLFLGELKTLTKSSVLCASVNEVDKKYIDELAKEVTNGDVEKLAFGYMIKALFQK